MTREETKNFGIAIVNRILHHHHHTQVFDGTITKFTNRKVVTLHGVYPSHKNVNSKINLYIPNIDDKFNLGDEVEIIIKKK